MSVWATTPTSKIDQSAVHRSVDANGTWEKKDFARPGVINLYNTYMGGVDLSPQRDVSCPTHEGSALVFQGFLLHD